MTFFNPHLHVHSSTPLASRLHRAAVAAAAGVLALGAGIGGTLAVPMAQAQSSKLAPYFEGSSEEREASSQTSSDSTSSTGPLSVGSSGAASLLFTPVFGTSSSPITHPDKDDTQGGDPYVVPTTVDYGPEPKLLKVRLVRDGQEGSHNNYYEMEVWSPANKSIVNNGLILPEGGLDNLKLRPTVYLLPGLHGGSRGSNWHLNTDFEDYFADKNVNVVALYAGPESMFADWKHDDLKAGRNQWATYMGEELPKVMEDNFHDNGTGAIAGLSMGGGPALHIASLHPQRFKAAASLSGFPAQSGFVGRVIVKHMIGKADAANLYGDPQDPTWLAVDPSWDPSTLKGIRVFLGTSWGIPTANEMLFGWFGGFMQDVFSQLSSNYFYHQAILHGLEIDRYQTIFGSHNYISFERELYAAWETTFEPVLFPSGGISSKSLDTSSDLANSLSSN